MKRLSIVIATAGFLAFGGASGLRAQNAPDPVKLDLARKLVEVNGGQAQAEVQMKAVFAAMQKSLSTNLPSAEKDLLTPLYDDLSRQMVKLTPQLLDISIRAYAQGYTEKELRDVIAFQMSESGQSMLRKAPQVRATVVAESMPLIMSLLPDMMRKSADRVCEEKHCTVTQRAEIDKAVAKIAPKS